MKPRIVISLLAVLLLTAGVAAAAQHPEAGEKAVAKKAEVSLPLDRPLISIALQSRERLVLSREQVEKLRSLRSQFQKGEIRRRADLRVQELELQELLAREPLDLSAVEAKVKRIEALRAEGRLSLIRALDQGKALLSEEQKKKLASILEKHDRKRPRFRGHPGRGMHGMRMRTRGCPMRGAASS